MSHDSHFLPLRKKGQEGPKKSKVVSPSCLEVCQSLCLALLPPSAEVQLTLVAFFIHSGFCSVFSVLVMVAWMQLSELATCF